MIKQKILMLESLREVGAALELLYAPPAYAPDSGKALLDGIYESLCADIVELSLDDPQANMLREYARYTTEVAITNIFKVKRWQEEESFRPWKESRKKATAAGQPSNLLLFHGTRDTNVLGILTQGLKIAPPEAPTTGYMFGKGIYCANTFVKSRNYCTSHNSDLLMFVCEVCVGETHDCKASDYIEQLPPGKNSTRGLGINTPDPSRLLVTPKGVGVPLGSLTRNNTDGLHLNYDEFIVYDQSQVRLKYIIKFRA